ncbi:MAG: hypothetical protein DHS20C12_13990 [Pseudohongiella sp.]|nr:MAG: hypothetical protein DHS20C12_13990 [Pseudohongiella sp.]
MKEQRAYDELDSLLSQPATIADRGFSEHFEKKIHNQQSARRNLFLSIGVIWLAAVLVSASPQAIYADFLSLALSLDFSNLYANAHALIQSLSQAARQLAYPTIAAGILSLAAAAGMLIRT